MNDSPKPLFDKKPVYDDDWIYDPTECKNCKKPISDHNSKEAFECAVAIAGAAAGGNG